MGTLDLKKTMNYVKKSVMDNQSLFSQDDVKQLDIAYETGEKCVEEESQKGALLSESQSLKTEKEKILPLIYTLATKIYNDLRTTGQIAKRLLFFKGLTPSQLKSSPVKLFEFIDTCYEHIKLYKEDSVIFKFKDEVDEIYNQISSYSTEKKEKSSKSKLSTVDKNKLYDEWYTEFKLLKLLIKIVVLKNKLKFSDFVKEFKKDKPAKKAPAKPKGKKGTKKETPTDDPKEVVIVTPVV